MLTDRQLEDMMIQANRDGKQDEVDKIADELERRRAAAPSPVSVPQEQPAPAQNAFDQWNSQPRTFWERMKGRPLSPEESADVQAKQRAFMPTPGNLMPITDPEIAAGGRKAYGLAAGTGADIGLEAGGATAGQALGAYGGPLAPVTVPLGGAIGGMGGNALAQMRRIKMGEQDGFHWGEFIGAAPTGAVPGASLAKAGAKEVLTQGTKYGVANVTSLVAQKAIDEGRLPTLGEAELAGGLGLGGAVLGKRLDKGKNAMTQATTLAEMQDAVRRKTIEDMQRAGYKIPPSFINKVNPSYVNNLLESVGGKAATAQQAVVLNQEITDALARKAVGLPPHAPLTIETLNVVRDAARKPFQQIEQMSAAAQKNLDALEKPLLLIADPHERAIRMADPAHVKKAASLAQQAAADLDAWQKANFEAKSAFNAYKNYGDKAMLNASREARQEAETLFGKIVKGAEALGEPQLAEELKKSRVIYAKAAEIENALNLGTGTVDASLIGRSLDDGGKLTGELGTIARGQQAFGKLMQEAAKTPAPGVNKLNATLAAAMGMGGAATMGVPGAALGVLPYMAEGPARSLVLSRAYQNVMARPNYGATMPDMNATVARLLTQAAIYDGATAKEKKQMERGEPPPMLRRRSE